jgi:predicted TIM-barrel fold metal-dependent hydrolase
VVFDAHVHTLSYGRDFSPALAEYYLRMYDGEVSWMTGRPWTAEDWCVPGPRVVEHMDAANVDRALIMALASVPLDGYDPTLGEYVAGLCDTYPDRFVGFYSANPTGGDEEAERLRAAVTDLGLQGLKMLPSYNGVPLNDARIRPLYAAAEELGVPVLLHTGWSPFPGGRTLANDHPLQLEDVLVEFPRLRAIVGHCGFTWSEHVLMLLAAHPDIGADLAYWGPTQPLWRAAQTLSMAKHLGVLDRLFWGTDYPFTSFAEDLAYWRRVPATCERLGLEPTVDEADVERFLGPSFARFLATKGDPA